MIAGMGIGHLAKSNPAQLHQQTGYAKIRVMNPKKRLSSEKAGTLEMWLFLIGFAIAFMLSATNGLVVTTIVIMVLGSVAFFGMHVYLKRRK